jgi:hypothetical protein
LDGSGSGGRVGPIRLVGCSGATVPRLGSDAKTLLEDALDALAEVHVVLGSEEESAGG